MRAALLALAVLACAAPAAPASQVYMPAPDAITVVTPQPEPNAVHVGLAPEGRVKVLDSAGIAAGDGCEQIAATEARCPVPASRIDLELGYGDGTDDFHANLAAVGEGITASVFVLGAAGADQFAGGAGSEWFYGYGGDDRFDGGGGADWLEGGGGNDLLRGGEGADRLYGWTGFDELDGGAGQDVLDGGADRDRVQHEAAEQGVRLTMSYERFDSLRGLTDFAHDVETIVGTPHADVLEGSARDDTLIGAGGGDRISGMGGADLIEGGDGDDLLLGDSPRLESPSEFPARDGGRDRILGGAGSDHLRGDADRDQIDGGEGDDAVDAREAESTQEVRDEAVHCGDGADRAMLDWNDEASACEDLQVRPRPDVTRPPVPFGGAPPVPGPGPQPVLGLPVVAGGVVQVPVHCGSARACAVRVRLRETVRVRRAGRRRTRAGRVVAARAATVAAGATQAVPVPLPARLRRSARTRLVVEMRIGTRRWLRPLTLGS